MKKKLLLIGGIAAMLFSSCDQDITNVINLPGGEASNTPATQKEITFTASMDGMNTRAVETTIANLDSFKVSALNYKGAYTIMKDVKYTSSDNGKTWNTDAGSFYWTTFGTYYFYAYTPDVPGKAGAFCFNEDWASIKAFRPNDAAANQKDFVYAVTTGSYEANGDSPVNLEFKHALAEISIKAKNSNTDYTVKVRGVELGNIWSEATFNFPKHYGHYQTEENWYFDREFDRKVNYRTTWDNPVTLTSEASSLDAANVPFMLIPQQLTGNNDKPLSGNYIAALITIEKGNQTICNCWSYVAIDTTWEMGKHYVYTLDFSNGLGKTDGNVDIAVKAITASVSVTDWVSKDESVSYGKK